MNETSYILHHLNRNESYVIMYWLVHKTYFYLFNAYINNLSLSLNNSGIGGSLQCLGDNINNHLCYADDLCLILVSSLGMQHLLDVCDTYAISHQLSYNATKSFSLCFRPIQFKINPPNFVLKKTIIPSVDKCIYLGIIVSETNCGGDLNRQMRKYYVNANILLRIFNYYSPDVKCIFKSYCTTIYCSSMCFDSTVTFTKKVLATTALGGY